MLGSEMPPVRSSSSATIAAFDKDEVRKLASFVM